MQAAALRAGEHDAPGHFPLVVALLHEAAQHAVVGAGLQRLKVFGDDVHRDAVPLELLERAAQLVGG